jgi:hypothetical protein
MAWTALRLQHKTLARASTCTCAILRDASVDSIQLFFFHWLFKIVPEERLAVTRFNKFRFSQQRTRTRANTNPNGKEASAA